MAATGAMSKFPPIPATRGVLNFTGGADLTAPKGKTGTLLLDPFDISICGGEGCVDFGGTFVGGVYTPTDTSFINNITLQNQLAISNVMISTGLAGSLGPDAGNLTVSAPVTWTAGNTLALEAANGISINDALTASGAGSSLSLTAGGDIIETFDGSIVAPALSATSSAGRVVLAAFNTVGSVSGSAPGGFSFFNSGALNVGGAGITSGGGSIALGTITGSITQTGPLQGAALFALAGSDGTGDIILNNADNAIGTLAGVASGNFQVANGRAAGLTIGAVTYFTSSESDIPIPLTSAGVAAGALGAPSGGIQVSTAGNLLVGSPVQSAIPDSLIELAAVGNFINNVGPGAIADPWRIYSASPIGDVFGGLDSGNTAVWNTTFGEPVTATGNRYIFAFQPKITVTASNLIKPYGQDVTALVAADYTISGVQPGVAGAFLPDTAGAVFSGAPLVFSAGSPASAPSTAVPYPIIVGPGSLVIGDGYGFAANNGLLFVLPLPFDPGFLPGLTQINNPAASEYDVGGYEQVLPHFAVACNEPPSLPDPNRFTDPDAALRAISQSLENYFRRCQNPTQATIADALEAYAAKLQVLAPRLPPALRNVPAIIAEGARRVRAARSRTEAVAVLRQTIAAVHKEIALVLSEDPATRSREVRDGDVVAGALGRTSVALVNSGGL